MKACRDAHKHGHPMLAIRVTNSLHDDLGDPDTALLEKQGERTEHTTPTMTQSEQHRQAQQLREGSRVLPGRVQVGEGEALKSQCEFTTHPHNLREKKHVVSLSMLHNRPPRFNRAKEMQNN